MTFLATVNGSDEALKVDIINGNASYAINNHQSKEQR